MTNSQLLFALLATPLATSLLAFACLMLGKQARRATTLIHTLGITVMCVLSLLMVYRAMGAGTLTIAHRWLYIDGLTVPFLLVIGVLGFITGLYSLGYMRNEVDHGEITVPTLCVYYGFFHLFVFTMLLAVTSNNLIMMWVSIEATTLSSTFLVGLYGQRSSLEAAWKYMIICTVGVAFGLFGTVLVYANAASVMADPGNAIFWTSVMARADLLDPTLMHLAFIFVLIGFGTKSGLFPMHAWLPDAHSEAPSPTSALLSAVLLKCALLVILRYYILINRAIGNQFTQPLFLLFGFLSVAVAAFFIISQHDIKRKLAYHSVQNMGLIAVGIGFGGPIGVLAALLHVINHSLAKGLLFCVSGNILLKYGTRDMNAVKGMIKVMPVSAMLLAGGALGLGGIPPFNVFISEFLVVTAGIQARHIVLAVLLLLILTVVLSGLVRLVAATVFGDAPEEIARGELGLMTVLPTSALLVMMLIMGIYIPRPVVTMLESATRIVLDLPAGSTQPILHLPWLSPAAVADGQPAVTASAILSTPSGVKK